MTVVVVDEEEEEDGLAIEETIVAVAVDTAMIVLATIVEEMEAVDTEGEIGVVLWIIEVTAEAIAIAITMVEEEEAIDTMTIEDVVVETTIVEEDAIDRPRDIEEALLVETVEDLLDVVGTIADAVVLEVDPHRAVETIAEMTEVAEVTREVLLEVEGVTTIVTGAVTRIAMVVPMVVVPMAVVPMVVVPMVVVPAAVTMITSAVVPQRFTAETIVEEEMIAVIVPRVVFEIYSR